MIRTKPTGWSGQQLFGNRTMPKQEYALTVYTENQMGIIGRIAIIFSRRRINIVSLNAFPSETEGVYRFIIIVDEIEEIVKKLCLQLEKQVDVFEAHYSTGQTDSPPFTQSIR